MVEHNFQLSAPTPAMKFYRRLGQLPDDSLVPTQTQATHSSLFLFFFFVLYSLKLQGEEMSEVLEIFLFPWAAQDLSEERVAT